MTRTFYRSTKLRALSGACNWNSQKTSRFQLANSWVTKQVLWDGEGLEESGSETPGSPRVAART